MKNDLAPPEGRVPEHPGRLRLAAEVHARPPMRLAAPAKVSHLVMLSGEDAAADERAHLALLCDTLDVAQPDHEARQFFADFGAFKLRWERHTEFASWTFVREGAVAAATFDRPFDDLPIGHVPGEWLSALPGEALVKVELALLPREAAPPRREQIDGLFEHAVGGLVGDGAAQVWTDFRLHDGATHILVHDLALTHGRRGRLVQRLIEIETYRMLALLAFPLARDHAPAVTAIDRRLADLTERLRRAEGAEAQKALLDEALALGAEIERIANATSYRFSAARAYYGLVERRIEELREQRSPEEEPGTQQLGQFLRRRLTPAMRTCESVRERLETASGHLSRTADLLRSCIDLDLAEHNRAQLAAMNRRGRLQLRLQQTVESLSAAAITYYAVGLFGVVYEALPAAARPVEAGVAQGLSVPVLALLAWYLIRRLRRGLTGRQGRD